LSPARKKNQYRGVHVVAVTELATPIDRAAAAVAAALGTLPYEERLKLAVGLPAVVLQTADAERAAALAAALRAHGHRVLLRSSDEVVAASDMITLRRFAFDDDALVAAGEQLPWDDVAVLVRAIDRRKRQSATVVAEKKLDLARAVITGGLVRSKTTRREVTTRVDESEPALYVFRASGGTPWILREQGTHYEALGARLSPTAAPNFVATVGELRARAPRARYDERLVTRRVPPDELDLLAHLVAWSLSERP
jgi:hypothetical protein